MGLLGYLDSMRDYLDSTRESLGFTTGPRQLEINGGLYTLGKNYTLTYTRPDGLQETFWGTLENDPEIGLPTLRRNSGFQTYNAIPTGVELFPL